MRTHKIIYILSTLCVIILLFVACNNGTNAPKSLKDTVPSAAFAPEINDTTVEINLAYITNLKFPKYKIIKENPIIMGHRTKRIKRTEDKNGRTFYASTSYTDCRIMRP